MSWNDFRNLLTSVGKGQEKGLVLVVGAGIHKMGAKEIPKDTYEVLACWSELLRCLAGENEKRSSDLTLFWEMLALEKADVSLPAYQREQLLRKEMRKSILQAEGFAKRNARMRMAELREIIRSGLVSDVISLNVDLILEYAVFDRKEWLGKVKGGQEALKRRREFRINGDKIVRVWHPHGDRDSINSLQMGMWGYQKSLRGIRDEFNRIKKSERRSGDYLGNGMKPETWLHALLSGPALFAGTSLSSSEWDIWYALLMRWRNQARFRKEELRLWWLCEESRQSVSALPELDKRFKKLSGSKWEDAWLNLTETFKLIGPDARV